MLSISKHSSKQVDTFSYKLIKWDVICNYPFWHLVQVQLVQRWCISLFLQTHAFSEFYVSNMLEQVPSSVLYKQLMGEVHLFVITMIKCYARFLKVLL